MAFTAAANTPRRSGQEAPRRHIPSRLSDDERWILEQSGWATFNWDVEPEDEKAISEGRLPTGAFIPPKLLVQSAPLVVEEVEETNDAELDALFGDGVEEEVLDDNRVKVGVEDDFINLLAQYLQNSDASVADRPNALQLSFSPASASVSASTPYRVATPAHSSSLSLPPPSRPVAHSRSAIPGPSSSPRNPFVTPALTRRTRDLRSSMSTPDLSPSGSSPSSDVDSDPEQELDASFQGSAHSYPPMMNAGAMAESSKLPTATATLQPDFFNAAAVRAPIYPYPSLEFDNKYANKIGSTPQMYFPSNQPSVAGPSSFSTPLTVTTPIPGFPSLDFDPADFNFDPALLDLDFNLLTSPSKHSNVIGPLRTPASSSRMSSASASVTPYSRKVASSVSAGPSRPRKRARARRAISDDTFSGSDSSAWDGKPELRCPLCSYVQKRGAGEIRSFKRHLETHPENKNEEWWCRGLMGEARFSSALFTSI